MHAAPSAAPPPQAWPAVSRQRDEYRRVRVSGVFLAGRETRVKAVSVLGAGFWILTPFKTDQGFAVLVNRGFVPPDARPEPPAGRQTVVGLLRISEPGGGFLRANDPAADRWYSRDVQAIAASRGLDSPAPYFIDAQASPAMDAWPRAGLTVVRFSNSHLVYAITWFAMALGAAWTSVLVWRRWAPGEEP